MINYKFSEIIRLNSDLEKKVKYNSLLELRLLSNITINQLTPIYEYYLRHNDLNAKITVGDYDNILQESGNLPEKTIPVIFWELSNLKDSFVYEIESFDEDKIKLFSEKIKSELNLLFQNTKKSALVIFNKFSHLVFTNSNLKKRNFENFVTRLNQYLEETAPSNFILIDIDKIFANLSVRASVDFRNYYATKALYTVEFFKAYTLLTSPLFFSMFSKTKKALIFDCDNTLWKGVVGEDGYENIELSNQSKNGVYFREVQLLAKSLASQGVIIGICSKNNPEDVEEVFRMRTDMSLISSDIVIKKVNWVDKAANLSEIASELNIGIDSLVFVDDSDFEVNLIRESLPQVHTIQVSKNLYEYPKLIFDQMDLFYASNTSLEDLNRGTMYKENLERSKIKDSYQDIGDYILSLGIKVAFFNKEGDHLVRIAQMTQKTNQFNLTTKRYSITDIQYFYESNHYDVISIEVRDKFGNSGVTGVGIVSYDGNGGAEIDTLLLSCRVLGRNIETEFINEIIKTVKSRNVKYLKAKYIKTFKNAQVANFYEKNHFEAIESTDSGTSYCLKLDNCHIDNSVNGIEILWKKK